MSDDARFGVYVHSTAQPGQRDAVVGLIGDAAAETSGLLAYSIGTSLDNPDALWATQLWINKAAHDNATHSEPVRAVTRRLLLAAHWRVPMAALSMPGGTSRIDSRATSIEFIRPKDLPPQGFRDGAVIGLPGRNCSEGGCASGASLNWAAFTATRGAFDWLAAVPLRR
ncbi:putative quinol monooxygenase [Nocardia sp. NPDC051570]|uniref:putative quinol monooxygenase n=1 Tax=Nocardia sp. NPDC051570 TaxID=3364324 RepID=UPI0037B4596C